MEALLMSSDLDLKKIGAQYERVALEESALPNNPLDLLTEWFTKAIDSKIPYANAATLSTLGADGFPSSRVILIKEIKSEKVIFFTNYNSKKAKDIEHSPKVSLNIYWKELDRQIRLRGEAQKISAKESKEYFHSRPYESQVSAIISNQSSIVTKEELENLTQSLKSKHPQAPLPYPEYWGGYAIKIEAIEFWQGRPNRLHDRFQYLNSENWVKNRLAP
jgi:pyridoxamine 5'-phosphate oxidase